MTLLQAFGTLLLLCLALGTLLLLGRAAVQLARRRPDRALRTLGALGLALVAYLALVAAVSLVRPRQQRVAGAPVCFDDWCLAATAARPAAAPASGCPPGARVWLVTLEVSSRARRVMQRELAAVAEAEDARGGRHRPCGPALPEGGRVPSLRDPVAPGESFALTLPFALPAGIAAEGVVVRHPYTPGLVILGDDEALLHAPTLLRLRPGV